jgi:hypothetical protein
MHGTRLPGAQLLSFRLRLAEEAAGGVMLETETGGRFWFGSSSLADALGEITAAYAIDRIATPGEWTTIVVPFHNLHWSSAALPGGALPSHALETVTLACSGGAADFADMRLLRPRVSTAARRPRRGHCIVGVLPGARRGDAVRLDRLGKPGETRITQTDQLGWFSFTGVAPGVYEVAGTTGDAEYVPARGRAIEVWADIPRLELTRSQ